MCKFCIFEAHFLLFLRAVWGKFSCDKGGSIKNFLTPRGVNEVSCRRGDSDFTLREGGNGTLPPPMPTHGSTVGAALAIKVSGRGNFRRGRSLLTKQTFAEKDGYVAHFTWRQYGRFK